MGGHGRDSFLCAFRADVGFNEPVRRFGGAAGRAAGADRADFHRRNNGRHRHGGHVGGRTAVYCDGLQADQGAKQALRLIRKAERVSSLLNDVVGDIVGVISGSAGSVIALYLAAMGLPTAVASVLIARLRPRL